MGVVAPQVLVPEPPRLEFGVVGVVGGPAPDQTCQAAGRAPPGHLAGADLQVQALGQGGLGPQGADDALARHVKILVARTARKLARRPTEPDRAAEDGRPPHITSPMGRRPEAARTGGPGASARVTVGQLARQQLRQGLQHRDNPALAGAGLDRAVAPGVSQGRPAHGSGYPQRAGLANSPMPCGPA